jgi:ketosteroid isomerase-like protein
MTIIGKSIWVNNYLGDTNARHLALLFIAFFIYSCQNPQDMKTQQQETIDHYIRAYNAFDIEGMCRDLHEEVVFQNVSNGKVDLETQGLQAFKEQAQKAKNIFREREQKITEIHQADDSATVSIDYTGILAVDLSEQMKAGDTLRLQGKSTFYFREGKIVRIVDES